MCIFTSDARVQNTKILVATADVSPTETHVVVAYQMDARAPRTNAMILPVPGYSLEVHDGDTAAPILEWMQQVSTPVSRGMGVAKSLLIPVERVGGYDVSVAPSVQDISRLDPVLFSGDMTPDQLQRQLSRHYDGEQFLVARLGDAERFRPLLVSYKTNSDKVLIPTLHLHHGDSIPEVEEYDHEIFVVSSGDGRMITRTGAVTNGRAFPPHLIEVLRTKLGEAGGPLGEIRRQAMYAWRTSIQGSAPNQDHYLVVG